MQSFKLTSLSDADFPTKESRLSGFPVYKEIKSCTDNVKKDDYGKIMVNTIISGYRCQSKLHLIFLILKVSLKSLITKLFSLL